MHAFVPRGEDANVSELCFKVFKRVAGLLTISALCPKYLRLKYIKNNVSRMAARKKGCAIHLRKGSDRKIICKYGIIGGGSDVAGGKHAMKGRLV